MHSIARVLIVSIGAVTLSHAAQSDRTGAPAGAGAEDAILEHLDEAEDAVESLLDWRHVLSTESREPRDTPVPTMPLTTLVTVPRAEVERLSQLIDAAIAMVPKPAGTAAAPRGDLRAHLEKAQEIARELMPSAARQPAGTSRDAVVVDRAALERLEVEIDAAERVAPRRFEKP